MIKLKRAYDPPEDDDGTRVLVDRLWPRGVSKERIRIDQWMSDIAPSNELRRWFHHDPTKWDEFHRRYLAELDNPERQAELDSLARIAEKGILTLVYGAKDTERNQAVVLKELIEARMNG
ncbi:MAG TPA: DUF488 domain-containing protein [Nitrolancea sp.]|nr:DUF488 domain-containing protein [Nitrolancea sp.]